MKAEMRAIILWATGKVILLLLYQIDKRNAKKVLDSLPGYMR